MKPTALGYYIGVAPDWSWHYWMCIVLDRRGDLRSMSRHPTKAAAQQERRRLMQWHKTLHAQREARRKRGKQ